MSQTRAWVRAWSVIVVCTWGGNQFTPLLVMYQERQHYSSFMVNALLGVYVLGLGPALLVGGSLSDRYGRRPLAIFAIVAAVAGSGLLAMGPLGAVFLVSGRLVSGCAVGVAMAAGTSWVAELSRPPFARKEDPGAGARRASLAFACGSGGGALAAGLLAQWGPAPEILPYLIHIAVALLASLLLLKAPETRTASAYPPGPWWRQLAVSGMTNPRFVRIVAVFAPWLFAAAALGYGYLPTQLRAATGSYGLLFATTATVVTLTASSLAQPFAKRIHSPLSARGLVVSLLILVTGFVGINASIVSQSIWMGLLSSVVIGGGLGIGIVSGLQEVQRIARPHELARLTGAFYVLAYSGFLAPALIAALGQIALPRDSLWALTGLAAVSWVLILISSRRHLPTS